MKKVQEVINKKFIGKIKQTPPVKSRVKRQEREREIYEFELLEQDGKDILFRASVEGGTYIRKLIDDLGKEWGIGAHMLELRRTRAGIFEEKNSITLYEFEKAVKENRLYDLIIDAGKALREIMPSVKIKKSEIQKLLTGKSISIKDILEAPELKKEDIFAGFSGKRFIGIYKVINSEKIFAKPQFVMQDIKG